NTFITGIGLCDVLESRCDNCRRLVMRHSHPFVPAPVEITLVRAAVLLSGKSVLVPSFEPGAHHRLVDTAIAIEAAGKGQPFLTDPRVPAMRCAVPAQVLCLAIPHRGPDTGDHALTYVSIEK